MCLGGWRRIVVSGAGALAGLFGLVEAALAVTVDVDTTTDTAAAGFQACTPAPNDCSLRGAIVKLNALAGSNTIDLPAGTYTLTIAGISEDNAATGDLDIRRDITIVGAGAPTTFVEAGPTTVTGIDRVFHVLDNAGAGRLTLRDLTVQHGNVTGDNGGGIQANGPLTLERVHILANQAGAGGGLTLRDDTTIRDSAISGNTATAVAGGGGIQMAAGGVTVTITGTTIANNTASAGGANGGGIAQGTATTTILNNVTIAGNSAPNGGGVSRSVGTVTLQNSIVANNTGSVGTPNCIGTLVSQGNNLAFGSTNTCSFSVANGDVVNTGDPLLGPLQNNGGPTPTMALGAGSAAIDAGNSGTPGTGGTTCAARDQRGVPRLEDGDGAGGGRCDIGAFEVAAAGALVVDRIDDSASATACTSAPNDCSLRGAVVAANGSGGRIILPHGIYTLTIAGQGEENAATGDLDVRRSIVVEGSGARSTTVQAGPTTAAGIDRVFDVIANGGLGSLDLRDLTVRNGRLTSGVGGAINANGPLTLARVAILDSESPGVGGLALAATTTIRDSLIGGNRSISSSGGGIFVSAGVTATIANTTITGNTAAASIGGGLVNNGASTTLNNVTIAGNAATQGGGIVSASGTLRVGNTIVASNTTTGSSPNCLLSVGLTSLGTNLVFGGDTCGFGAAGDLQAQDPKLGPLQDNGGPTSTLGLGLGSAAIDAGNSGTPGSGGATCEAADQRGVARPLDGDGLNGARCDIGAFESQGFTMRRASGNGQSTETRTDFAIPLAVTITANAANEPVGPGGGLLFSAPSNGASLDPVTRTVNTTVSGASFVAKANTLTGSYMVTASSQGVSSRAVKSKRPAVRSEVRVRRRAISSALAFFTSPMCATLLADFRGSAGFRIPLRFAPNLRLCAGRS